MSFIKKLFQLLAKYLVFVAGLLFIFAIGVFYALLRPEGILVNLIFLLIAIGWIIFLIKYFWDIMDKDKSPES